MNDVNTDGGKPLKFRPKVLIVGCGELGIASAELLAEHGYHVIGARRSVNKLPDNLDRLTIDVQDPTSLSGLSEHRWAAVIVTLTADSFNQQAYHASYVDGLRNVLAALSTCKQLPLVLFASSTSVYGQNDGSVVNEASPTAPAGFSGQTMLQAEALLADYPGKSSAIRFGGIYGRNAGRLVQRLQDGFIYPRQPLLYSNRIHYRDCCRTFLHLIRLAQNDDLNPCYLAVDSHPALLRDIMEWLAERQGIDIESLQETEASTRGGNKRCSNAALLASGFTLQYPDYQAGFAPLVFSPLNKKPK